MIQDENRDASQAEDVKRFWEGLDPALKERDARQVEDAVRRFWEEMDSALAEIDWRAVPVEVGFADVFERLLSSWFNSKSNIHIALLKEHDLVDADPRKAYEALLEVAVKLHFAVSTLGSYEFDGLPKAIALVPRAVALAYFLMCGGMELQADGPLSDIKPGAVVPTADQLVLIAGMLGDLNRYSIADQAMEMLKSAEGQRLTDVRQLSLLTRGFGPSPRTRRFLFRVTQCYLYGFDVECLAMCRGALEAELEAEISTDDCITHLGSRGRRREQPSYSLIDRIAVARALGRFTPEQEELAHRVRKEGNEAVHRMETPGGTDIPRTVGDTLELLRALTPEGD